MAQIRQRSSMAEIGGETGDKICKCGRFALVRTSWTEENPGRRFYACPLPPVSMNNLLQKS